MNVIAGIGWITQTEYGCVMKGLRRSYSDMGTLRAELQEGSVLSYPVKGFGKYDLVSRMTCCVSALALHDAEMSYSESRKQDVGILGTNRNGCLQSNLDFFRDFVENGRTLGRAKFFVYTLSSIPMAEAALHFNCQGPLLYMGFLERQVPSSLSQCDRMILRGESAAMLAVIASEEGARCFVVRRVEDVPRGRAFGLEEVMGAAERESSVEEMIGALADIWREKAAWSVPQADQPERGRR
jgi:hypothetical protein